MAITNQIEPSAASTFATPSNASGRSLTTRSRLASTVLPRLGPEPGEHDAEDTEDQAADVSRAPLGHAGIGREHSPIRVVVGREIRLGRAGAAGHPTDATCHLLRRASARWDDAGSPALTECAV